MALPKKGKKTKTVMATSVGRVRKPHRKALVVAKSRKGGKRGARPTPPLPPVNGGLPIEEEGLPAFRSQPPLPKVTRVLDGPGREGDTQTEDAGANEGHGS